MAVAKVTINGVTTRVIVSPSAVPDAALRADVDAIDAAHAAHVSDTENPHGTTPEKIGAVPVSREVRTVTPITGGGPLTGSLDIGISDATPSSRGAMTATQAGKLATIEDGATNDADYTRPSLRKYENGAIIYIAHRGAAFRYPENTAEAYAACIAAGFNVIEQDAYLLSDGALGVIHDSTVDAVTTSTGNVAALDSAAFQALTIDSDAWHGGGFGDLSPVLLDKVLATHRAEAIFIIEAKNTSAAAAILAALEGRGIRKDQVIVQSFTLAELVSAADCGAHTMHLDAGAADPADAVTAGVGWAGVSSAASDAHIQSWVDAGVITTCYGVTRRYRRDELLALGVRGFFADDPEYLSTTAPLATEDTFSTGTWMAGMVHHFDSLAAGNRGRFYDGGYWGWGVGGADEFDSVLQGWASPIKGDAGADDFTIELSVRFESALSGDEARWAAVFLGANDRPFIGGSGFSADNAGLQITMRKNGGLQIYNRTDVGVTLLATYSGAAFADGEEVRYRIVVTPTDVSAHRLDGSGTIVGTATSADATYRGGYLHIGRYELAVQFRDVVIS